MSEAPSQPTPMSSDIETMIDQEMLWAAQAIMWEDDAPTGRATTTGMGKRRIEIGEVIITMLSVRPSRASLGGQGWSLTLDVTHPRWVVYAATGDLTACQRDLMALRLATRSLAEVKADIETLSR